MINIIGPCIYWITIISFMSFLWFWEICGNQWHGFGRIVEINDIVLGEMWKSMTWFWENCGNQWHYFRRNVEINDMVLEEMWKSMKWFWEIWKSMTWFWEKCGNQWHGFGRNVEINDMVLGEMWKSTTWFWDRRNGVNLSRRWFWKDCKIFKSYLFNSFPLFRKS